MIYIVALIALIIGFWLGWSVGRAGMVEDPKSKRGYNS